MAGEAVDFAGQRRPDGAASNRALGDLSAPRVLDQTSVQSHPLRLRCTPYLTVQLLDLLFRVHTHHDLGLSLELPAV